MEPLVTISIAIYNVEKFIIKGIEYILNQTYTNLEIILVDDGSTDSSPLLCDELLKKDRRIKVVHKKNGGLGSARNVGIENANGKYLYFFDIDDIIENNFIEYAVNLSDKYNTQFMIMGYYAREEGGVEEAIALKEHLITSNEILKKIYLEELYIMKHGNGFVWNKFYTTSFLKQFNFKFGNQKVQQDEAFNMQLYLMADRVYITPKIFYHYIIYKNNSAGSKYIPNKLDIFKDINHKFLDFYKNWEINDKTFYYYIYNRFYGGICNVLTFNNFHKDSNNSLIKKYQIMKDIIDDKEVDNCIKIVNKKEKLFDKLVYNKHIFSLMIYYNIKEKMRKIIGRERA